MALPLDAETTPPRPARSQTALLDINRPSKQAQMMSIWGMGIMIGPILGPILGGWLTENRDWRAVFYGNVPIGALALLILIARLPSRRIARKSFDLVGFGLIAVFLSSLQLRSRSSCCYARPSLLADQTRP